jgi:hypothetical protein
MNKLFIIGIPRTGTTSISAAFLEYFKVFHTAYTKRAFESQRTIGKLPIKMLKKFNLIGEKNSLHSFLILKSVAGCKSEQQSNSVRTKYARESYKYTVPEQILDGWQTAGLSDVNIAQLLIEQMIFWLDEGVHRHIDSIIIDWVH